MPGLPNTHVIHPLRDARWRWRHTITVEPYQGWNTYGPPVPLQCLLRESPSTSTPNPGSPLIGQVTVNAPASVVMPAGSRITLPDGRRGYLSASTPRDGGGLRYAGDIEGTIVVSSAYGPPFGETVVLLRQVATRDAAGSTTRTTTQTAVAGCAVRQLSATEVHEGLGHDIGTEALEVIAPPDTDVTAADQMQVRGLTYEIDGKPQPLTDATTTAEPGVRIIGRRTTNI